MKNFSRCCAAGGQGLVGWSRRKDYRLYIVSCVLLSVVVCLLAAAAFADDISARAAVVISGAGDRILYAKNPNVKLPPASTTKLITAMVALDRLGPDTVTVISENAAATPSVSPRLRKGEKYTIRDLLNLALMRSVNSAAVALAEAVAGTEDAFVSLMNEKAAKIGSENTRFINASGLPGPGQYITAYDLANVMKESLRYPMIKEIINTRTKRVVSSGGRRLFVKNTNQLLWADDDLVGGKTGYTREARHCFVCAAEKGNDLIVAAVLGESVRSDLWEDSRILLSKGYDVLAHKAEPMIYFSDLGERPVMHASYIKVKSERKNIRKAKLRKRGQKNVEVKKVKARKHRTRSKDIKEAKLDKQAPKKKNDDVRPVGKKHRKKKVTHEKIAEGVKRSPGKDIS